MIWTSGEVFVCREGIKINEYFKEMDVLDRNTKPKLCYTKVVTACNSTLSVCWWLNSLPFFLIQEPAGWNQHSKSTASLFRQKPDIAGKLKCCSTFSGFHAQWLLGALALKAISAPSGVKLAWIYKSIKVVDWICTPDKGYVLVEQCYSRIKLPQWRLWCLWTYHSLRISYSNTAKILCKTSLVMDRSLAETKIHLFYFSKNLNVIISFDWKKDFLCSSSGSNSKRDRLVLSTQNHKMLNSATSSPAKIFAKMFHTLA